MGRLAVGALRWAALPALLAVGSGLAVAPGTPAGATSSSGATAAGWTAVVPPVAKGVAAAAPPFVKQVACPAPGSCVAAGFVEVGGTAPHDLAWAAVLAGGSWAAVTLPFPHGSTTKDVSRLTGVSCPTRDYCVAVGSYGVVTTKGQSTSGLVEIDTRGVWSVVTTPAPDTRQSVLRAVDCLATRTCAAAGVYQNPGSGATSGPLSGTTGEVVVTSAGLVHSSTTLPLPTNALGSTTATAQVTASVLSCAGPAHCALGGQYETSAGKHLAFFDVGTGTSWSNVPITGVPAAARKSDVTSVSCPVPGTCEAVVTYQTDPTGTPATKALTTSLLVSWSGGKLTSQVAPLPAGAITGAGATFGLSQLSCPTAGGCVAVGYYRPTKTASQGLVETLSEGRWTASTMPLPTNADTGSTATVTLNSVDCAELGQCTAVGQYKVHHTKTAFVATLTTGVWTVAPLPVPPGAKTSGASRSLTVSCAFGACAAGGAYTEATGTVVATMLETLTPSFSGYDLVGADGGVFVLPTGQAGGFYGSLPTLHVVPNAPIVGMVPTISDKGYFLVGRDGGVYAFGNAPYLGSLPGLKVTPAQPVTGIVAADGDNGYFLVGRDGGVYAFGTVPFLGSLPGEAKNVDDIIGIASTPSGDGYWLVGATGAVYAFGAARKLGTATGLSSPVSAIAGTPTGAGYWVVTANGTVKAFGDAATFTPGTLPADRVTPALPVIGIVRTAETTGYWLLGADGGIFAFGTAPFDGSLPGLGVHVTDVVGAVPT